MKKLWILPLAGILFFASCAQKKENREEFKEEHNKDSLRNEMGNTAVANSERANVTATDSVKAVKDTAETPTNYEKTKPNTSVGGSR